VIDVILHGLLARRTQIIEPHFPPFEAQDQRFLGDILIPRAPVLHPLAAVTTNLDYLLSRHVLTLRQ